MNTTIDLRPYITISHGINYLSEEAIGLKAAEETKLVEALNAGAVELVYRTPGKNYTSMSSYPDVVYVKSPFVSGLLKDAVSKLGPQVCGDRLHIGGHPILGNAVLFDYLFAEIRRNLNGRINRAEKSKEAKNRAAGKTEWSDPVVLLIPDIGTVLRLTDDWTFRLYSEHRNGKFMAGLKAGLILPDWRSRKSFTDVTIKAGAQLTVNRVYIRQGAEEFSSLTFNIAKGATVEVGGVPHPASGRFWAKLSDVNRMKVVIDKSTLSEN